MKQRLKLLGEYLYFMLVAIPIFCCVITGIYLGYFILDTYKLIKKSYEKVLQSK